MYIVQWPSNTIPKVGHFYSYMMGLANALEQQARINGINKLLLILF